MLKTRFLSWDAVPGLVVLGPTTQPWKIPSPLETYKTWHLLSALFADRVKTKTKMNAISVQIIRKSRSAIPAPDITDSRLKELTLIFSAFSNEKMHFIVDRIRRKTLYQVIKSCDSTCLLLQVAKKRRRNIKNLQYHMSQLSLWKKTITMGAPVFPRLSGLEPKEFIFYSRAWLKFWNLIKIILLGLIEAIRKSARIINEPGELLPILPMTTSFHFLLNSQREAQFLHRFLMRNP